MTSPGDVSVNVDRLHQHASQRRIQAADFITDKPPPVPSDPDDPTTGAAGDLATDVHGVNHALHGKTNQRADKIDADGRAYSQQDQGASGQVGALNGGGSKQQAANGLTDVGIGSIMNSLLAPLGQVVSGATQGINGLAGAGFQGVSTGVGQGINVAGQMSSAMAKNMGVGSAAPTASLAGGGGAGGGDDKDKGRTEPASATSPLPPPSGEPTSLHRSGDYVTPDEHDHTVHSTGMGGGGGGMPMAGMGAAAGGSGSPTKPRTYQIHVPGAQPGEPEPTPVIAEAVYAASPLQKDAHGADT